MSKKTGKDGEEQEHTASGHTFAQGGAMETDDATLEEFNLDDYDEDEEGQALHKINYEDADDGQMVEVSPISKLPLKPIFL